MAFYTFKKTHLRIYPQSNERITTEIMENNKKLSLGHIIDLTKLPKIRLKPKGV